MQYGTQPHAQFPKPRNPGKPEEVVATLGRTGEQSWVSLGGTSADDETQETRSDHPDATGAPKWGGLMQRPEWYNCIIKQPLAPG
jgi:hypothetical protein